MNLIFLMDPLESINPAKDTTFVMMLAAHKKGHQTFHLAPGDISFYQDHFRFHVTQVQADPTRKKPPFRVLGSTILHEKEVSTVFIRTDPPFNERYLMDTWLLDRLPDHVFCVNSPSGVRTVNEKIWATQFKDLTPPTLISRHKHEILAFEKEMGPLIGKPLNGFGGSGIFKLQDSDVNKSVILESLTFNYSREALFQPFLPEADKGDKRILLLNGKPLGALMRIHGPGDHRNNLFAGGKAAKATLTARDHHIIETLAPHLKDAGLHFVGIDIIGEYLIEVNVTSPTCIQELNALENRQETPFEDDILTYVEAQCKPLPETD